MKKLLDNQIFMWKICAKASPKYMAYFIYDIIRNQLMIFVEHTLLIRYVLHCAEYHESFYKALIAIGAVFILYGIFFVLDGYFVHGLVLKEKPKIYKSLRDMLYERAAYTDLACYDNPEYYNDFVLAVAESNKVVDRFYDLLSLGLKSLMIFLTTGVFYITVDVVGLWFLLTAFALNIFVAKSVNKLKYKVRMAVVPYEKKRNYVSRIFYMNDYAKEIRLHHEVGDMYEEEYSESNKEVINQQNKIGTKCMWLDFTQKYLLSNFITDGIYIAYLVYKAAVLHTIDYSNAVVLFNRTGEMRRGLESASNIIPNANENNMYIEKIRAFLANEPMIKSGECDEIPKKVDEIVLEHVSFKYTESARETLHDISLTVKPGERVAIVGYNGAGKTTLVKLLMRLYDTTEGRIMYGGKDIREYSIDSYRNRIGVIFQDYQIYGASLFENVVMDNVSAKDKDKYQSQVSEALIHSGFGEKLNTFKQGLDTPLTTEFDENGINLSGGESQKVATARTFYKDSDILIMDEPSSALDPIAEYSLNKSMDEMAQGRTVFFISHRLSTTRDADRIIVLKDGRVVEEGTHEFLLGLNGIYAQMWKIQAGRYHM